MRRPGLWLAVGALTAGIVLLGAAGCGSSSGGNNSVASQAPGGQSVVPHVNGGTLKAALHGDIDLAFIGAFHGTLGNRWVITRRKKSIVVVVDVDELKAAEIHAIRT